MKDIIQELRSVALTMEEEYDRDRLNRVKFAENEARLPNMKHIVPERMWTPLMTKTPKKVKVYRATSKDYPEIRPGDWIALEKSYARKHQSGERTIIVEKLVPALDVLWAGTDLNEYFYAPAGMAQEKAEVIDVL